MTISHLAQLRQLLDENTKLKRMHADLMLMHHALKDVAERKLTYTYNDYNLRTSTKGSLGTINSSNYHPHGNKTFLDKVNVPTLVRTGHRDKKSTLKGCFSVFWRRRRDSNPRWAINPHTLSRRAT